MLRNADMAMYRAKEEGRTASSYSPVIGAVSEKKLQFETGLREAVGRDEISLHYQAKVEISSGEIRGVER